jgi:hypothetical protein
MIGVVDMESRGVYALKPTGLTLSLSRHLVESSGAGFLAVAIMEAASQARALAHVRHPTPETAERAAAIGRNEARYFAGRLKYEGVLSQVDIPLGAT